MADAPLMPYNAAAAVYALSSIADHGTDALALTAWIVVQSEMFRSGCDDIDERASFCRALWIAQIAIAGAPVPSRFARRGES